MQNKKINFLTIAKFMLLFVIITIYPITNLYARYISKDNEEQSAGVARFDVNESFVAEQNFSISIKPGETVSREIIINNNSNVEIKLTIDIENVTNNLPLTFIGIEEKMHANTSQTFTVKVIWSENETSPEYAGMVDVIKLLISAEQVD